jgi:hypothetical protein
LAKEVTGCRLVNVFDGCTATASSNKASSTIGKIKVNRE